MGVARQRGPTAAAACLILLCCGVFGQAAADVAPRLEVEAHYPEGPLLLDETLYYAEMTADRITLLNASGGKRWPMPQGCGPTSISPYGESRLVVLCHLAGGLLIVSREGEVISAIAHDIAGARIALPNDSHTDHRGGIYFSSSGPFDARAQPAGKLMHLNAAGEVRSVADELMYPNGVFVTAEGVVFLSEHIGKRILRFRVKEGGAVTALPVFADHRTLGLPPPDVRPLIGPDGLEVAADGTVYVAIYGAGKVLMLTQDGRLSGSIKTDLPFLTNIALDEPRARAFLTGAFDNTVRPYPGKVIEVPLDVGEN